MEAAALTEIKCDADSAASVHERLEQAWNEKLNEMAPASAGAYYEYT